MQFVAGVVVGVIGYMLFNDPSLLSDLLHQGGDLVSSTNVGNKE
jgi:hypothetical protein|tara:strand:- start:5901 stop:6032 length:132 start_codon:yes stop_codon:yes gene_type:complete